MLKPLTWHTMTQNLELHYDVKHNQLLILYYWKNYQTKSHNFSPNNLDKLENLIKYLPEVKVKAIEL